MPEWLEAELSRQLAPVAAPAALAFPAPGRIAPRRTFRLAPILAAAAAIAVFLLAALPSSISPSEVNRYLAQSGIRLPIPAATPARIQRTRVLEAKGARIAEVTYRLAGMETTVRIARASSVQGPAWQAHGTYAIACAEPRIACVLCHANL